MTKRSTRFAERIAGAAPDDIRALTGELKDRRRFPDAASMIPSAACTSLRWMPGS